MKKLKHEGRLYWDFELAEKYHRKIKTIRKYYRYGIPFTTTMVNWALLKECKQILRRIKKSKEE